MGQIAEMIVNSATMGLSYAERLVKDIPAERFGRFATLGGEHVVANHPAFALGHLCLYPQKAMGLLGKEVAGCVAPSSYEELFSKNATCQDDSTGGLYPAADEIIAVFKSTHEAAFNEIRACSDELLLSPNPVDSPMKEKLPSLGAMLNFYLTSHVMIHLGQVSTWRRVEKLPPA